MTEKQEQFFELSREFDRNHAKFMWWNGAEFGTILGGIVCAFVSPIHYWILFGAFWVEFAFACYYQRKTKKILAEMDKLVEGGK